MDIYNKDKMEKDFVVYMDTDSLHLLIEDFIEHHVGLEKWESLSRKDKIKYTIKIAKCIEEYVNTRTFENTQKLDFNSKEEVFKINFKQEIVAQAGIWIAKKKYGLWKVDEEGAEVDELFVRGLEIIRSDTPESIRGMLKELMSDLLKDVEDEVFHQKVVDYKAKLRTIRPEEIAANIGCNNIALYRNKNSDGVGARKGTPWNIKAAIAYEFLIKHLGLQDKYQEIEDGNKAKVVYVTPNRFKIDAVAFTRWPIEFEEEGIKVDYTRMIDKFFVKKIEMLLKPMNQTKLIADESSTVVDLFF